MIPRSGSALGAALLTGALLTGLAPALEATPPALASLPRATSSDGSLPTVLSVYKDNRTQGIANYVTADLALLGYSLRAERSIISVEEKRVRPAFAEFVARLEQRLRDASESAASAQAEPVQREVIAANRTFVTVLGALLRADSSKLQGAAADEYRRVLEANSVEHSPLWSRTLDYTQFLPRGRYGDDPELSAYFRAMRYAGSQLFCVTESRATGVDTDAARRLTRQALQLATLIEGDDTLEGLHHDIDAALAWQFGRSSEFESRDWLMLAEDIALAQPDDGSGVLSDQRTSASIDAFRERLLQRARSEERQPRVFDAIVDLSLLEPGTDIADVLTGWRLLGSRSMARTVAQQRLLYPATGAYNGSGATTPFGLGVIGGRQVKAYPAAMETLQLIANGALDIGDSADGKPAASLESAFEGYDTAFADAVSIWDGAQGAEAQHASVLRAGAFALTDRRIASPRATLLAFDARQRHAAILYARQTYSPVDKSFRLREPERLGADLEAAPELYLALASAARSQADQAAPGDAAGWRAYAEHLDRLQRLSYQRMRGEPFDAEQQAFLNRLDQLFGLDGADDGPIVVDVHTDAEAGRVVQLGTGVPGLIEHGQARGAVASFHEFKQPMDKRMTLSSWRKRLLGTPVEDLVDGELQ